MGLGFYGVDKVRKFDGILNEKDRNGIPNNIPIPFLRIKFDRKPPNIANRILRESTRMSVNRISTDGHTELPRAPWTVLNRTNTGVVRDDSVNTGAYVYCEARLSCTLKYP